MKMTKTMMINTQEYQCVICGIWKTEENIERFEPCICMICDDSIDDEDYDD